MADIGGPHVAAVGGAPARVRPRVAVLEPDRQIRNHWARICAERDFDLLVLEDDRVATFYCASGDVVVVDVCPDGVVRIERIQRLRARLPHTCIVAVTAYPSVALVVAVMRAGATTCLSKPLYPSDIVRVLEREPGVPGGNGPLEPPSLGRVEWDYIARILDSVSGNISRAARLLGIQRSTLQRKLKKLPPPR